MGYILKEVALPNGAIAMVHRPVRLESDAEGMVIVINSFLSDESQMLMWQDRYLVSADSVVNYPRSTMEWLIKQEGPFQGGTIIRDLSPLELGKRKIKERINTRRESEIHGGANTPAGRVDTDEKSLRNILGAYQSSFAAMMTNQEVEFRWRMADNSLVTLDPLGMIALGNAVLLHTQACYQRSWELKDEVDAAKDQWALDAIDINEGWD